MCCDSALQSHTKAAHHVRTTLLAGHVTPTMFAFSEKELHLSALDVARKEQQQTYTNNLKCYASEI
jgi:hypothetical protein